MLNIKSLISLGLLIPSLLAATALEANANNGKGKNNDKKPDAPAIDIVSPVVVSSTPTVTAPTTTCQAGGVTGGLLSFTSCISGTGNDVQSGKPGEILTSQLATGVFGGIKDWSLLSKVDAGKTSSAFNWSGGDKGTWSVTTPLNRPFVLSLKAGTAWSAYYFANASAITQGTWDTLGVIGQKAGQDLSHASIFVAPDDNPPKPVEVPEPTGLVALGVVGALGVKGLKKRALNAQN